ncbi:endonuclease III domain-containing protein [Desulfohalobiaceae bacterium Ax17]|uniref:endonuclease III domain-containing protein n=1 Tax=Desulfovulcanus ferrireducens TaxID=2831190 RepID=UPI00207BAABA|nr:endonuclease III domain-containing protein [Desulfovulcanus ferrireducens]MBT8763418.1 endonuclease III domain-containing protein [Desulfovulcanus ferrireducens]
MDRQTLLLNIFSALSSSLGPSHWWPGETPFEVAVGTILTQNTNWQNVEKAIFNLKQENLLTPHKLYTLSDQKLAQLIRPAGYFRIKTKRLKNFLSFLYYECDLNFDMLKKQDMQELRPKLLQINGIGPETADSILLYALEKPSFVVDAYTRRMFNRHGLVVEDVTYEELRSFFMDVLPPDVQLYNEFHALIVRTAKKWCLKKKSLCSDCPLAQFLD